MALVNINHAEILKSTVLQNWKTHLLLNLKLFLGMLWHFCVSFLNAFLRHEEIYSLSEIPHLDIPFSSIYLLSVTEVNLQLKHMSFSKSCRSSSSYKSFKSFPTKP